MIRLSACVHDIPPRLRYLIGIAGVAGIVLVIMGSMVGGKAQTVDVDKIIHFSGYFVLGLLAVLSLPPWLCVPALFGLIAMGIGIEMMQPINMRGKDVGDAIANSAGVLCGGIVGLIIRVFFSLIRREFIFVTTRKKRVKFSSGSTIIRQGANVDHFFVIHSGSVQISREENGQTHILAEAEPGDAIGVLGVIRKTGQYITAEALEPTVAYRMDTAELMASAGGPDQPVAVVMRSLAGSLALLAKRCRLIEEDFIPPTEESG